MNPGQAYRIQSAQNVSPVRLVVMLYEQLISDLQAALSAHERGDIEFRASQVDHALLVVGQLQGTLNMEQGGEVARNLDKFYDLLRFSLLATDLASVPAVLRKQIANLLHLRDGWIQVDSADHSGAQPVSQGSSQSSSRDDKAESPSHQNWSA